MVYLLGAGLRNEEAILCFGGGPLGYPKRDCEMSLPTCLHFILSQEPLVPQVLLKERDIIASSSQAGIGGMFPILHVSGKKETGRKCTHVLAVVISGCGHRSGCFSFLYFSVFSYFKKDIYHEVLSNKIF